jgi:triosephosphate isomerase
MRKNIVAGNWKMNLGFDEALGYTGCRMVAKAALVKQSNKGGHHGV